MDKKQFQEIVDRLDKLIGLLKENIPSISLFQKIGQIILTVVEILGIIGIIEIIRSWIKGG
jgi:hypothetical protein